MASRVRVTFVIWSGDIGGTQTLTRGLSRSLRSRYDIDAQVLVLKHAGAATRQMERDGTPVETLDCAGGMAAAAGATKVRRYLARVRPDVLVLTEYGAQSFIPLFSDFRGPVVVVVHGGPFLNPHIYRARVRLLGRASRLAFSSRVSAEVSVSAFMCDLQTRVRHARRLVVIPNGVDTELFSPARSGGAGAERTEFVVAAAGRLIPEKGFGVLIRAVDSARRTTGSDIRLVIAGEGLGSPALGGLIESLGLYGSVSMLGPVSDMPSLWRGADVACVPSTARETFGLVAVEAQACGLPVLASDAAGLREVVVHGRTGFLVAGGDHLELAQRIGDYAQQPALVGPRAGGSGAGCGGVLHSADR